jgi:DNA-binding MarR family transcriptional regulator
MRKTLDTADSRCNVDNPAHILGFLLKSLQHTLRQRFDEALRKQGVELSFAQFAALFNLHSDSGVTGGQLARRAMVSAQTMNSALHALEQEGYIERRPHPHSRRADSWSLTAAGLEELDRARQVGSAIFARMLADFESTEIAAFEDYLRRCIFALGGDSVASASHAAPVAAGRSQRRQNAGVSNTRNV